MKTDGKYILGTAHDIAEACLKDIIPTDYHQGFFEGFKNYAFAVVGDDYLQYESMEELALSSEGWCGIRKIDTGFDSSDLNVIADYYGGLNPILKVIDECMDEKQRLKTLEKMIITAANYTDNADENTLFIAEPCI